jgi:hypothetical protein
VAVAVGLRLFVGGALTAALGASQQLPAPMYALGAGIAAPLILAKLAAVALTLTSMRAEREADLYSGSTPTASAPPLQPPGDARGGTSASPPGLGSTATPDTGGSSVTG